MSEKITLRHVAELADVSVATVSLVLNDREGVSQQTRDRVMDAALKVGYIEEKPPEAIQRTLRLLSPYDVGEPRENIDIGFYGRVLGGVERECRQQNISLIFSGIMIDPYQSLNEWPPMAVDADMDGFIIIGGTITPSLEAKLVQLNKPILLLNSYTKMALYDAVYIDNFAGAYAAVTHLIEKGHTHIGVVGSNERDLCHRSIYERRQGYLAALADHNIQHTYITNSLFKLDVAEEAAYQLLKDNPQITAVFACNDHLSVGVMDAARRLHLKLPDDLSIVGFDDDSMFSTIVRPSLTTMRVDQPLLGVLGVRMLLNRIENPAQTPIYTTVTTSLVERESVKDIT
ncbi:MAG: LacI family DNA-binding transcriptional regulator [Aggregatilineales bacterium]